jgi:predicted GNAT family acetyltransferase
MSIRLLTEKDRAVLHALAAQQPEQNLYLLGNLESVGFTQDFCTFWGDFSAGGTLRGVANRYFTGWSIYGLSNADWRALAALVDADPNAARLQDNPGGTPSLLPFLITYGAARIDVEELMRLDCAHFRAQEAPQGWRVRRAIPADLDALADFYAEAGDMARTRAGTERPLRDGRVFVAVDSFGHIGAAALTNAETRTQPLLAMIGGVYTAPALRGQGLGKAVCSALCASLCSGGTTPILYWQHPSAGRIYRALGFRPIGSWRSIWLVRQK